MDTDSLATIVKNSSIKGYLAASGDDNLMASGSTVDELIEWTLNLPGDATIDDYRYRLEMARTSLGKPVLETMKVLALRGSPHSAAMVPKPVNLSSQLATSTSGEDDASEFETFTIDSPADSECASLCECVEPVKIESCMDYCERLLVNSIEL